MLGERPIAEYGIVLAALSVLVLVIRAILSHLRYVHDTTPTFPISGNGDVLMRADIKGLKIQMDDMYKIWIPDRAKQISDTHTYILKMETLDMHKSETMKELLKESKKTNVLLEKFIALNTAEHNIIIRDIRATQKPWENQFNKK